jgi:uncharacterized protein YwgA
VKEKIEKDTSNSGWFYNVLQFIEGFIDMFDGIKRRETADQIYKDLVNERIGRDRAALELNKLNKRQKGGWFLEKVSNSLDFIKRIGK